MIVLITLFIRRSPLCLPNDHVIFVDDASQGAIFNGKAIAYDHTGSAFEAAERDTTYTHTKFKCGTFMFIHPSNKS